MFPGGWPLEPELELLLEELELVSITHGGTTTLVKLLFLGSSSWFWG